MRLAIALAAIAATNIASAADGLEASGRVGVLATQHGVGLQLGVGLDMRVSPYVGIGLYGEVSPLFERTRTKCECGPEYRRPYRAGAFAEFHALPRNTWDPFLRASVGALYTERLGADVEADVALDHRSDAFAIGAYVGALKPIGPEQAHFGLAAGLRMLITL